MLNERHSFFVSKKNIKWIDIYKNVAIIVCKQTVQ